MRLIDLDRVCMDDVETLWCTDIEDILTAAADYLEEQPAVDAVPVVRCKDCKHYALMVGKVMMCECDQKYRRPVDFCSYAERKADNG